MKNSILKKAISGIAAAVMLAVPSASGFSGVKTTETQAAPDSYHDDWLHVNDKAQIVDMNGNEVWLTGINWFGYNVGSQIFAFLHYSVVV